MDTISHTDLILNPDGSVYHLHLLPEDIAGTILLVGDPGRVKKVSRHFNSVEVQKENREFVTHTGTYSGERITVLSTGIGTDNIDIVLNELDALVNVDLERRKPVEHTSSLNFIRLGTCGALHREIVPGTSITSVIAGGFDNLYHFYRDPGSIEVPGLSEAFRNHTKWPDHQSFPYFVRGSEELIRLFARDGQMEGITLSSPGFYAPQVRSIRLTPFDEDLVNKISSFHFENLGVNNFEMECSALYALSAMLGHQAVTICVAIANRITSSYLEDYQPQLDQLIIHVLDKLSQHD